MKTKVFVSWSGKNTDSFIVAKKIAEFLPKILQNTDVFMSDNIQAGTNFVEQITKNLSDSKVGIICVTKDNFNSPWLNFETGALSNVVTLGNGVVTPVLINMTTDELQQCSSPIRYLHAVTFDYDGIKQLITSINKCLAEPLDVVSLNDIFEAFIPKLLDINLVQKNDKLPPLPIVSTY